MALAALLAILIIGCKNKRGSEWKELVLQDTIQLRRMYKIRRGDNLPPVRQRILQSTHRIPNHNFGKVRDAKVFGNHILVLLDRSYVKIDMNNWRITQPDIDASKFDHIITFDKSYVLFGQGNLLHIDGKKKQSLKFNGIISNVLEYNNKLIVVLTDGRSYSYNKSDLSELWSCIAPEETKIAVTGSIIVLDKLFMVINGQIASVDLDSGTVSDYINITNGECDRSSIIHMGDKVIANANEVVLEMHISADSECTKYRIKDLQAIKKVGDHILLITKHETLVTTYDLLANGNYLYSVSGNNNEITSNSNYVSVLTNLRRLKSYDKYGRIALDVPTDRFLQSGDKLLSMKNNDIVMYQ